MILQLNFLNAEILVHFYTMGLVRIVVGVSYILLFCVEFQNKCRKLAKMLLKQFRFKELQEIQVLFS